MYHGRFVRYIYLDIGLLPRQHVPFQLATVGKAGKTATVRIIFRWPNNRYIFYMQYFLRGMNDIIETKRPHYFLHKTASYSICGQKVGNLPREVIKCPLNEHLW